MAGALDPFLTLMNIKKEIEVVFVTGENIEGKWQRKAIVSCPYK